MYEGAICKIDDISLWNPDGKDQISGKEASECRRHNPVGEGEVILDDVAAVQAGVGVRPLLRRESTQQQKMHRKDLRINVSDNLLIINIFI